MLGIDASGLDATDLKLLRTIAVDFKGGPVGVDSLAAALGDERSTIEDVVEPYLIQQGYMSRTARGRQSTDKSAAMFGLQSVNIG